MTQQQLDYLDGDTPLKGYISFDENAASTPMPAVLICPDWTGHDAFADAKADMLSHLGLVGFAIDIYGNGQQGANNDEKAALMQPFMDDRSLLRRRLLASLEAIKSQPFVDQDKIAIIGFCFGGLCALDLARAGADIKGAVSFHGHLFAPDNLDSQTIKAKILALHGYDDPMILPDSVQAFAKEMTEAKVDWQVHMYGNTQHSFTNPLANDPSLGTVYSEVMEKRSMRAMEDFLQEIFS